MGLIDETKMPNGGLLPMEEKTSKRYELSGKIMLSAIIILFAVVVFIVILHLYARWCILRQRRRELRRRRSRNRRAQIVFYVDDNRPTAHRGLEPAVINSLPVFEYDSKNRAEPVECAVCLCEFEESEKGRVLPKCNHSFHIECIDMWFNSHSTCPLCRSPVEAFNGQVQTGAKENEPVSAEPGSTSTVEETANTTSLGGRRKGIDFSGVRVEVPSRSELEPELTLSSPASRTGFRSPGSRLLSLKRILSMNRRTPSGPSTPFPLSTELDLERGELTRDHTPN